MNPSHRWWPPRRAALPPWTMVAASGFMLGAMACGSDDSTTPGTGGSVGTGGTGTIDSGSGGARPDSSSGGGGRATGGAAGTGGGAGGAAGSGGIRTDAASEAAPDATPFCNLDGGDASGDCCPDDPLKTLPGVCGCGVADLDTDNDGVPDCIDVCPTEPTKTTSAGVCGCAGPDVDTDNDGTLDCLDGCPQDRMRLTPGPCGCGVPDNQPLCLQHRYSFNDRLGGDAGAGDAGGDAGRADGGDGGEAGILGTTVVADSIGHADGTAVNVVLTGTGSVHLAGGTSDQYIRLPSSIISALGDNATFEAWVTWDGLGGVWQRIFDFGNSNAGDGNQGVGQSWIFLSPQSGPGFVLASMVTPVGGVNEAPGPGILLPASMRFVAVVVDTAGGDAGAASLSLYVDAVLQNRVPLTDRLSTVRDVNNWLGRSQFAPDPEFAGTYHEFRIYSKARTQPQLEASRAAGPDVLPGM